ncbi:MAG TPA: hypothetical protein VGO93_08920 [Candidatus Xenobia bacterium]
MARRWLGLVVVALMLVLQGCGGGAPPSADGGSSTNQSLASSAVLRVAVQSSASSGGSGSLSLQALANGAEVASASATITPGSTEPISLGVPANEPLVVEATLIFDGVQYAGTSAPVVASPGQDTPVSITLTPVASSPTPTPTPTATPTPAQFIVNGTTGPWLYANGGLNTNFQYGVGDETGPLVITQVNGVTLTPGASLTISYVSGMVAAGSGFPLTDAVGDTAFVANGNPGSSGRVTPSAYMDPATYPIFLCELVGTFADKAGNIVGTPFKVGDSATVVVPTGATQLQLGVDDDIYSDNSGSYTLTVTLNP